MADEEKPFFDDEKQKKTMDWLEQKWAKDKRKCEICSSEVWSLSQDVVVPATYGKQGMQLGGRTYPQIMVICNNCGHTKYFNAVIMGVIDGDKNG